MREMNNRVKKVTWPANVVTGVYQYDGSESDDFSVDSQDSNNSRQWDENEFDDRDSDTLGESNDEDNGGKFQNNDIVRDSFNGRNNRNEKKKKNGEVGFIDCASKNVNQTFVDVKREYISRKNDLLVSILQGELKKEVVIVFVQDRIIVDFVCFLLRQVNLKATSIDGYCRKRPREHQQALSDFCSGKCSILVAPGVASLGQDIKSVDHVFNYDMPQDIDEYIHRIGLAVRGTTTFVDRHLDRKLVPVLITILKNYQQMIPLWLAFLDDNSEGSRPTSLFAGPGIYIRFEDNYAKRMLTSVLPFYSIYKVGHRFQSKDFLMCMFIIDNENTVPKLCLQNQIEKCLSNQ